MLRGNFDRSVERNRDAWSNKMHVWLRFWQENKGKDRNFDLLIALYILILPCYLLKTICLKNDPNLQQLIQTIVNRTLRVFESSKVITHCNQHEIWQLTPPGEINISKKYASGVALLYSSLRFRIRNQPQYYQWPSAMGW